MVRFFRVFFPASVLALLVSEAAILFSCFLAATYLLIPADPWIFLAYEGGFERIGVVVATILLGIYMNDLYTNFRVRSQLLLVQQVCLAIGAAFLFQALISYSNRDWIVPRWIMITGSFFSLIAVPVWRVFYSEIGLRAFGRQRVLFLGTAPIVLELANHLLRHPEFGYMPVGYLDNNCSAKLLGGELPCLGTTADLRTIIVDLKPDRIVTGLAERRQRLPVYELLEIRLAGVPVQEAATMYEAAFGRVCSRELRPSQLVYSEHLGPGPRKLLIQEVFSFLLAVVALVIAAPVMIIVAVLVKFSSPGPVLYRQTRTGLNGKPFTLYKFRSMRADAEAKTGAVWAQPDDPRVTPVGRWIRKLRLDELPQLLNVLRGEMVIVGPRPERPEFVKTLVEKIPYYQQRHCVKPGITGWAQVNHKYGDTIEDTIIKLEYDLYYIKNLDLSLDLYIMFQTAKVMLLSRGAH